MEVVHTHSAVTRTWDGKASSLWPRRTQGWPQSWLSVNRLFKVLARVTRQKQATKGIWVRKENKLSLLADDMILDIKTPENSTKIHYDSVNWISVCRTNIGAWRGSCGCVDSWLPQFLFGLLRVRIWTGAAHVMVMGTQRSTKGQGPNNPFTGHLQRPDSLAPGHALRLPTSPPKHHSLLSKPFTSRGHLRSKP